MLLCELDTLPEKLKIVWEFRTRPRAKMVERHYAIDGTVVAMYHMEVFIPNTPSRPLFRGPEHVAALEAMKRGWEAYGRELEIVGYKIDLVSAKLAQQELKKQQAGKATQEMFGMSIDEVVKYVAKHKELPPVREGVVTT